MGDRADKAKELFTEGYNCSQSVLGAFADLFDMDFDLAMKVSEGLGGGMGRMRLTCGAVSSMSLIAGLKLGCADPKDLNNKTLVYAKVQEMANTFREKNGSIICGELLGLTPAVNQSPVPEKRTSEYYKKRPCAECVKDCALIIEEYLLSSEK